MKKLKLKKSPGSKPVLPKGEYGFVIGNGTSRKDFDVKQLQDYGIFIACNWFFKEEFIPHVLVCSDEPITKDIYKERKNYPRRNHFYTWFPKPGSGMKKIPSPEKMAAGPSGTFLAAEVFKCPKVFLIGMDFFGFGSSDRNQNGKLNNLYEGHRHYQKKSEKSRAPTYRNWQRRFQWLMFEYPWVEFYHVAPFEGKSPERLRGIPNFHQITWENLQDHLHHDAELVDILEKTPEDIEKAREVNPDDARAVLERQLGGQENVIYKDAIHPDELVKMRLAVRKQHLNGNQFPSIKLGGFQLPLPPIGRAQDKNGKVKWVSEDALREYTFRETHERFELMKKYYAEHPDKKIRAMDFNSVKDTSTELDKHVAKFEEKRNLADLPPPPPPPPLPL